MNVESREITYKEKLLTLHKIALEKLKILTDYETALENDDELCDNVCDTDWYNRRHQKYEELQEALAARDQLAKRINEQKIDINLRYTE